MDAVVEEAIAPVRVLTRSAWPLAGFGGGEVSARSLEVRSAAAESYGRAIAEDLILVSLPTDPELLAGRRLVPARVLSRLANRRDDLVLEPWTTNGIEVGMPVCMGNDYLGRVVEVDTTRGQVVARLVTARDLFVGARLVGSAARRADDVRFVVGGVAVGPRPTEGGEAPVWLAAHNPSRPGVELDGELVVDEFLGNLDRFHELSRGLRLGTLARGTSEGDWHVVPRVDFLHGVFQVVIVIPVNVPVPPPPPHPIADGRWVATRFASAGDPSPWRQSVALALDRPASIPIGAAAMRDARLLGRVTSATRFGVDVALLADPGLALPVAGVPLDVPGALPRVLGRIVSLGLDPGTGLVRFHLRDALPLEIDGVPSGTRVRMRLVTGSGEAGLPAGLLVGDTELVTGSSGGRGRRFELIDAPDAFDGRSPILVRRLDGERSAGLEVPR